MLDFADCIVLNKFEKRGAEDALRDVRKQWRRNHPDASRCPTRTCRCSRRSPAVQRPRRQRAVRGAVRPGSRRSRGRLAALAAGAARAGRRCPSARPLIPGEREPLPGRDRRRRPARARTASAAQAEAARRAEGTARRSRRSATRRCRRRSSATPTRRSRGVADPTRRALARCLQRRRSTRSAPRARRCCAGGRRGEARDRRRVQLRRCAATSSRARTTPRRCRSSAIPKLAVPRYRGLGRDAEVAVQREPARRLPLHRRRLPVPPRGGGSDPHVRRRGPPGAHQPALPLPGARPRPPRGCRPRSTRRPCTARIRTPRPDIYGRIGNSGVSIATLDDMKKLYSGFDLCAPATSVSMTINGPAPMHARDVHEHRDRPAGRALPAGAGTLARPSSARIAARLRARGAAAPLPGRAAARATTAAGLALLGVTGDELVARGRADAAEYAGCAPRRSRRCAARCRPTS